MKIVTYVFIFIFFSLGIIADQVEENSYIELKRQVKKHINSMIEAVEQKSDLQEKEKMLFNDPLWKKDNELERSEQFRRMFYAFTYEEVMNDNKLSLKIKKYFIEFISEGMVNDNTLHLKQTNVDFLCKIFSNSHYISEMNDNTLKNIRIAYEDRNLRNRDMIFLAYITKLPQAKNDIENLSKKTVNVINFSQTAEWAAILIMAQRNDFHAIKKAIALTKKSNVITRSCSLFDDLAMIKSEEIVLYLKEGLNSKERLPELKVTIPGEFLAARAAKCLSKMLEGFPQYDNYNTEKALDSCRIWMKSQKSFHFK